MNKAQFWNIDNVSTFRDFDVINGEVTLSDNEYANHLNEQWGDVTICGMSFAQGDALRELDPTAFSSGKSNYESSLDEELNEQLSREDSDDIEFVDGDEYELDEEDEDE